MPVMPGNRAGVREGRDLVDDHASPRGVVRSLRPVVRGTTVAVTAGPARPPMQPTPDSLTIFGHARRIAVQIGVPDLRDGSTGGGSDGNLVAALGVPTLDGLGPEGGGAHADDEHVITASMPVRAALLAGLLSALAE